MKIMSKIDLARQLIEQGVSVQMMAALKREFPELKESDDERIRKALLGLTYIDGIEPILTKCSVTRQELRAYLEKQKEQKPAEWRGKEMIMSDTDKSNLRDVPALIRASNHPFKENMALLLEKYIK